jgi:ADP-heptose:LPS heptosyltransferase
MGLLNSLAEWPLRALALRDGLVHGAPPPESPHGIFVLRNNSLGDVLCTTPLFDALRRRFPNAEIWAGIGPWARPILENNPHITGVLDVAAPWTTQYVPDTSWSAMWRYIYRSPEVDAIRARRCDIGIDVVGSHVGQLLLRRAGIGYRVGLSGYRGGQSLMQRSAPFSETRHVARLSLDLAELLGATDLPPARPQLFLTAAERAEAEARWMQLGAVGKRRIVLTPGAGLPEKRWPAERFRALTERLLARGDAFPLVLGAANESSLLETAAVAGVATCAESSLRKTFAMIATADGIVCNSSVALHAAAAFNRPTALVLGPAFPSAKAHELLWGYPETATTLGREPGRDCLAEPGEVEQALTNRGVFAR